MVVQQVKLSDMCFMGKSLILHSHKVTIVYSNHQHNGGQTVQLSNWNWVHHESHIEILKHCFSPGSSLNSHTMQYILDLLSYICSFCTPSDSRSVSVHSRILTLLGEWSIEVATVPILWSIPNLKDLAAVDWKTDIGSSSGTGNRHASCAAPVQYM